MAEAIAGSWANTQSGKQTIEAALQRLPSAAPAAPLPSAAPAGYGGMGGFGGMGDMGGMGSMADMLECNPAVLCGTSFFDLGKIV